MLSDAQDSQITADDTTGVSSGGKPAGLCGWQGRGYSTTRLAPCGRVNSSKGSARPKDFLRRSNDGKGLEYKIVRFCEYVEKY